jgi:hypothetical protein
MKKELAEVKAKVDEIYRTTDLQAKIDVLRDRPDFYDNPEAATLRSANTFAEKLMVTHAFHGLKGVATVLNFTKLDQSRFREAVIELRKAGDDLSKTIADLTEVAMQMKRRPKPTNWQRIQNKRKRHE